MNFIKITTIALFLCFASSVAQAIEFEGITFPDTVTLDNTKTPIQLNGVGFRTKFVFDVYIGALYTESKVKSRDAVQALKGPNRIHMHFVHSEVSKEKLINGWNDGFENNNSDEVLKTLSQRITKFNEMFSTVVKGDVVLLDYVPGMGTKVTIHGIEKGVVEGEDFNAALLDLWLGEEPGDEDLKDAMLGL